MRKGQEEPRTRGAVGKAAGATEVRFCFQGLVAQGGLQCFTSSQPASAGNDQVPKKKPTPHKGGPSLGFFLWSRGHSQGSRHG